MSSSSSPRGLAGPCRGGDGVDGGGGDDAESGGGVVDGSGGVGGSSVVGSGGDGDGVGMVGGGGGIGEVACSMAPSGMLARPTAACIAASVTAAIIPSDCVG